LPITISDETGNIDAIAFSFVAEDLVERNAYLTSQNMKVDVYDHVVALDTSVGKTKLFLYVCMEFQQRIMLSDTYLRKASI
jgi:hypothetical protein